MVFLAHRRLAARERGLLYVRSTSLVPKQRKRGTDLPPALSFVMKTRFDLFAAFLLVDIKAVVPWRILKMHLTFKHHLLVTLAIVRWVTIAAMQLSDDGKCQKTAVAILLVPS